MISYYELLTMIKNEQYPKILWHNSYRDKISYIPTFDTVNGELEGYRLENRELETEDIRYWLSECMLESSMFEKCLEVTELKIKKLELISNGSPNSYALLNENGTKCGLTKHSKIMCDKINEIIDFISKEEK